jgi:hypothetical protein
MNRKSMAAALCACTMFFGVNCFAALTAAEKGYVDQLATGGPVTIRSVAQNIYNAGNTNTEVLDVAAEVLLEKYPRAGGDPDTVDAMAWLCRTLGRSGNSRYRPVLEKVENDESVHRKLRGHCEKGAESLPKQVSNAYVAGTVNLARLRDPQAAAATAATGATAAAAAPAAAAGVPGSVGAKNPPPAKMLKGYSGYELKPVALADEAAGKKNVDKVVAKVDENVKASCSAIIAEWNAAAGSSGSKEMLVIEPQIASVHKSSGATRFFAGAFSGDSYIILKVRIREQSSGKVLADPEFYRRANAMAGAWTFGAHDNAMLQKIASLLANYLTSNYTAAVGGETGWEP